MAPEPKSRKLLQTHTEGVRLEGKGEPEMATAQKRCPRTIKCLDCGEVTPNIYNRCDDCDERVVIAERAAQGLPPMVEDPEAYRLLARHIVANEREMTAKAARHDKVRPGPLPADRGSGGRAGTTG